MDRQTRDKFVAITPEDLAYAPGACRETPRSLFEALNREFKFDIDLTANEHNHLLPAWLGPKGIAEDALAVSWLMPGLPRTGFSNPPYGPFIPRILQKAIKEAAQGFTSVFLLPMRASNWYQRWVIGYADEVRHVKDRVMFTHLGKPPVDRKGKPTAALFDSIVVVYRPEPKLRHGCCPHFSVWSYARETARV